MAKSRDKRGREEKKKKKPKKAEVATQSSGFTMTSPRREPIVPSPPGAPPA
ncbi:MAG TPA: hypothetical protein VET65_13290 [Candidatus Limnocylindrales bacterium]|nr:hypothetical protein [Candidatus Limnocylindrales bacterium]